MHFYATAIIIKLIGAVNGYIAPHCTGIPVDRASAPWHTYRHTSRSHTVRGPAVCSHILPLRVSDGHDRTEDDYLATAANAGALESGDSNPEALGVDTCPSLTIDDGHTDKGTGKESHPCVEDGDSMEFARDSTSEKGGGAGNLKISRRLWKLLMALLIYRAKHGDYVVDPTFKFTEADEPRLKGFCLGAELDSLLESIKLHDTDIRLYNKIMADPERYKREFSTQDIVEAPRLLWLIGFPTATYLKARDKWRQDMLRTKNMYRRLKNAGIRKEIGSFRKDFKEDTEGDPARLDQIKKVLIEFIIDHHDYERAKMSFNKIQKLPSPSNRARVRPGLLKGIVTTLVEIKQSKNSSILTKKPTRDEIEGGHHYAFYHWSFEDVINCMVLFNDMYMDYNRELLIDSEKHGTPFTPITFNTLKPEWRVPSEDPWPENLWGLPLGAWLEKFRNGDIDAKQHWLRRDILDYLQFDWGDGLKYLTFTWDKLVLGLLWYINIRGFPIMDMAPQLVVSNAELVAKWGKPEEIQGLKLGHLFYSALDQIQVLRKYYPQRYEFMREMGIDHISTEDLDLGYRPQPHHKLESLSHHAEVSKDGRYLRD
ncbi:fusion protein, putative [Babesia caballi]|uniref:Fusion protein, putative n=1 Tax=Babesia caballi TaxID=5871 RepID=A0AAV4LZH2_BABCB|nr:fusion protein, putative [Babesia caballi]